MDGASSSVLLLVRHQTVIIRAVAQRDCDLNFLTLPEILWRQPNQVCLFFQLTVKNIFKSLWHRSMHLELHSFKTTNGRQKGNWSFRVPLGILSPKLEDGMFLLCLEFRLFQWANSYQHGGFINLEGDNGFHQRKHGFLGRGPELYHSSHYSPVRQKTNTL